MSLTDSRKEPTVKTMISAVYLIESARVMLQRARKYAGIGASSRNFARRVSKVLAVKPRRGVRNDAVLHLAGISKERRSGTLIQPIVGASTWKS